MEKKIKHDKTVSIIEWRRTKKYLNTEFAHSLGDFFLCMV